MKNFKLAVIGLLMLLMPFSIGFIYSGVPYLELNIDGEYVKIDSYTLQEFLICLCDYTISTFHATVDYTGLVTMETQCKMLTCDDLYAPKMCTLTKTSRIGFNTKIGTVTCINSYTSNYRYSCIGRVSVLPFYPYDEVVCALVDWDYGQSVEFFNVNNDIIRLEPCNSPCSQTTSTRRTSATRSTSVTRTPTTRTSTKTSSTTTKRVATTKVATTPRITTRQHLTTSRLTIRPTSPKPTPQLSYFRTSPKFSITTNRSASAANSVGDNDKDKSDDDDNDGLTIGMSVFAVIVVLTAAAVILFFYVRRRQSKRVSKNETRETPSNHFANAGYEIKDAPETSKPEATPQAHSLVELANKRRELQPVNNIYTSNERPEFRRNLRPMHRFQDLSGESSTDDIYVNESDLVHNQRNTPDNTYEPIYYIT
ncbi:hypothetical protein Btru_051201 [Bulinus truncatus]|nr:hypothetical protein Btru_051201 [Bulinus truncatus]